MKTTKFFAVAAIVCGFVMSLASCSTNDIPVYVKPTTTISFESANLNADGYWCGDEMVQSSKTMDQRLSLVLTLRQA